MRYIVLKFIFLSLIILPLPSLANDGDGCVGHARRIQNAFGRLLGGSGDAADARRALPDSVARILDPGATRDDNVRRFREAFNTGELTPDNQFISVEIAGGRQPVRITEIGPDGTAIGEIMTRNGPERVRLTPEQLVSARSADSSRFFFERGVSADVDRFRDAVTNGNVTDGDRFISYQMGGGGQRVPARVVDVDAGRGQVTVELEDGSRVLLDRSEMLSARPSETAAFSFSYSPDPSYRAFRQSYNDGTILNSTDRYISFPINGDRLAGEIISVGDGTAVVRYLDRDGVREVVLTREQLMGVKTSSTARERLPGALQRAVAEGRVTPPAGASNPIVIRGPPTGDPSYDGFRDAFNRGQVFEGTNRYVSFPVDGGRRAGEITAVNADGSVTLRYLDGRNQLVEETLSGDDLLGVKFSSTARNQLPAAIERARALARRSPAAAERAPVSGRPRVATPQVSFDDFRPYIADHGDIPMVMKVHDVETRRGVVRSPIQIPAELRLDAERAGDIRHFSPGRASEPLEPGTYTWVVRSDGSMSFGRVRNQLEFGVKHFHIADNGTGVPVMGAGEIRVLPDGSFDYNFLSGTYTMGNHRQMLGRDPGAAQGYLDRLGQTVEAFMGRRGREVGNQAILEGDPPSLQEMRRYCRNQYFRNVNPDLCGNL